VEKVNEYLMLSRELRSSLEAAVSDIFETYASEISLQSRTYVVPAVWGPISGNTLDRVQEGIHRKVNVAVESILEALTSQTTSSLQDFGTRFLVRELFVWRLAFMRQLARNCMMRQGSELSSLTPDNLKEMKVAGSA
jgi:hypothetical protein